MTPTEFFTLATEWLLGDAIDDAPATDAEFAQFRYLSEWDGATITFRNPAGFLIVGTVTEVDADDDAIWLFVRYLAFTNDSRAMHMTTWLTTADVNYIAAGQQTATTPAEAEVIAAH